MLKTYLRNRNSESTLVHFSKQIDLRICHVKCQHLQTEQNPCTAY